MKLYMIITKLLMNSKNGIDKFNYIKYMIDREKYMIQLLKNIINFRKSKLIK